MKLVVCYTHGGYEGTWTENLCVEYESKDHFLVAFIDAFEAWSEQRKEYDRLQKRLADARASRDQKKIDVAWSVWQQYCQEHRVHGPIVVDGMVFDNYEDFERVNGEYVMVGEPYVYTLDEWFELNRPEVAKKV
jgi:hypothetical protein